jgi:predicted DNA-binding transcriptional regulator YafY
MADELVTIAEAVQRFEVSPSTLRRMWRAGDLRGAVTRPGKFGAEVVIPEDTLGALFSARDAAGAATRTLDRLVWMLEAEQAGRAREVAALTARLAEAERQRDAALERLRATETK